VIRHAFFERRSYVDPQFPVNAFQGKTFRFLAHWHNEVELVLVLSGSMVAGINREKRLLKAGDFALSLSGDVHWYDFGESPGTVLILIFRPEVVGHADGWPLASNLPSRFVPADVPHAERIGNLMRDITGEVQRGDKAFQLVVRGQIALLCGLVERYWGVPGGRENTCGGSNQPVRDAIEFVHRQYRRPLMLDDVAQAAGLTPGHFSRVFSRAVGSNFRTYLNGVRVEAAEQLLLTTDASVTAIAFECGFDSLRTFNRAFKAKRGVAPRALRQPLST